MRALRAAPWRGRVATAGAALALLLAGGCGRPSDEAWLKFLGFQTTGEETTLTSLEGDLNDGTTNYADAKFSNASITPGATSGTTGSGITLRKARVEYKMSGHSPPSAEYPLSLYLAASTVSSGTTTATTGTLTNFPLATAALKQWLIDQGAGGDAASLTAQVTFYAETDEGTDLEVSGSIAIVLSNAGQSSQVVYVEATTGTTDGNSGQFTVGRTGSTDEALTVSYTVGGTAEAGTDYAELGGYVVIKAGASEETISVTLLSGYTAGRTVVVTLTDSSTDYSVGSASKATITIVD